MSNSVSDREQRLENLVRWLALPYAGKPVFAAENPFTGEPMQASLELEMTWCELFGDMDTPEGRWVQCQTCGHWAREGQSQYQHERVADLLD